jgi:L-cysteine desulfidase
MLRAPVFDQITSVDRPADLAFIRISRVVTATASTTSGLLMDTRATSDARSKTTLRPTLSFISSGVSGISPSLAATAAPADSANRSTERLTAVVTDPIRSFRVIKY